MKKITNILIIIILTFNLLGQIGTTSSDNSLLATLAYDQGQYRFFIHNLKTGNLIKKINAGYNKLSKIEFSKDKEFLIALSSNTLYIYNVNTGMLVKKFYQTKDFALSNNNFLIIISNSYPYLINLSTVKQTRLSLAYSKIAKKVAISPQAKYMAVITNDKMVYVYKKSLIAPVQVIPGSSLIIDDTELTVLSPSKQNLLVNTYLLTEQELSLQNTFDTKKILQQLAKPYNAIKTELCKLSPNGKYIAISLKTQNRNKLLVFDLITHKLITEISNDKFPFASLTPIKWTNNNKLIIQGKGINGLEYDPITNIITSLYWNMFNPRHNPALLPKEQAYKRRFSPNFHFVAMPLYEGSRRFLLVRDAMLNKHQISYADADFICFSHDSKKLFLLIQGIVFQLNTTDIRKAMLNSTPAKLSQLGSATIQSITEKYKPVDDTPPKGYHYPFTNKLIKINNIDTEKLFVLFRGMNLDPKNVEVKLNLVDENGNLILGASERNWLYLWCNLLIQHKSLKVEQENFVVKEVHETQPSAFALVLDHSGSMGDERANALQFGAWQLIKKKRQSDAFLLIKYDNNPKLIVKLTKNSSSFYNPLANKGLNGFGGGTALNDALYLAISNLSKNNEYKRKVIYLFTDGYENSSKYTKAQVIGGAIKNKIEIFTIGFGNDINEQYLQEIAYLTGGSFYHIYHTQELKKIFVDVDLKRRYYYSLKFITDYPGKYIALLQLCQNFKHHDSLIIKFNNDPKLPPDKKEIKVNPKLIPQQKQAFTKKTIPYSPPDNPVTNKHILTEFNNIDFPNIIFAFDSDKIIKSEEKGLNEIAAFMKRYPYVYLMIEGYTDNIGSYEYNLKLSQRRAQAAKRLLIAKGIAPGRIFTKGYGETRPIASNETEQGRAMNRRIEFHIFTY